MTWDVRGPLSDEPVLRLTFAGPADARSLGDAFGATLASCAEHDAWLVLTDLRGMTAAHSVVDLFGLVTMLTELEAAERFREALLVGSDPGTRELAEFFETAAVNRGLAVRMFTGQESDALAWLTA